MGGGDAGGGFFSRLTSRLKGIDGAQPMGDHIQVGGVSNIREQRISGDISFLAAMWLTSQWLSVYTYIMFMCLCMSAYGCLLKLVLTMDRTGEEYCFVVLDGVFGF